MLSEPHDFSEFSVTKPPPTEKVAPLIVHPERLARVVTKLPVTKVENVTKVVTKVMGRPRKYKTHAERQAAYRERKRGE